MQQKRPGSGQRLVFRSKNGLAGEISDSGRDIRCDEAMRQARPQPRLVAVNLQEQPQQESDSQQGEKRTEYRALRQGLQ